MIITHIHVKITGTNSGIVPLKCIKLYLTKSSVGKSESSKICCINIHLIINPSSFLQKLHTCIQIVERILLWFRRRHYFWKCCLSHFNTQYLIGLHI